MIKKFSKKTKQATKILFVFLLVISWILASWPQIRFGRLLKDFNFPPTIQEVRAAAEVQFGANSTSVCGDGSCPTTWSSPSNVQADDATYAQAAGKFKNQAGNPMDRIQTQDMGFTLVSGTIGDIVVELQGNDTQVTDGCNDFDARLLDDTGTEVGTDQSRGTGVHWGTTESIWTYTWTSADHGLSAAQIQDVDFGFYIDVEADANSFCQPRLDYIQITVNYTPASGPQFTQNNYGWYVDSDAEDVTDFWGNPDIAQNTAISALPVTNDPPGATQELRLRVNISVSNANMTASSKYFKLQYKQGTDANCTTGSWTDVGAGGGGEIWRYATSSVTDGTDLTVSRLSPASGVLQEYIKSKPTGANPFAVNVGQTTEYDFHIEHNGAADAKRYSLRVVETDNTGTPTTAFNGYTNCPTLTTEPGTGNLLRHGNFFADEVEQGFFWAN